MSKSHWTTTTLEDICQPGDGLQTGPFGSQLHASEYTLDGVPVIMPKDMVNQRVSTATIARIPDSRAEDLKRHRLKVGDIVFGRRGDIGRCVLITCKEEGWICGSGSLRVRLNETVSSQYLIYYLSQPEVVYWLESNAVGQTMLNLSAGILASLPVEFPPLPEQRKIANILSTWDEAIALTEQLIDAKQKRKQGLMQRLLTGQVRFPEFKEEWAEFQLGSLANLTAGGTPSTIVRDYWDGNIRWMNSGEINLRYIYEVEGRITQLGLDNSSAKLIPPNSVMIALAGQGKTRGMVAVNKVETATNQSIAAIIPDSSKLDYLYLFFNLDNRYDEMRLLSGGNSGRGGLNLTILKNVVIRLPTLQEQRKIAEVLSACDIELDLLQQKLAALRQQKKGLMQQLLTGKIRVKV